MPGLTVHVLLQDIKRLESDALIVGFFENVRPLKNLSGELDWLLCGNLSNLIIKRKLQGRLGDAALLTSQGKIHVRKIFMIGLGPVEKASADSLTEAARAAVKCVQNAGVKNVVMECFHVTGISLEDSVKALLRGISAADAGEPVNVQLLAPDAASYEKIMPMMR